MSVLLAKLESVRATSFVDSTAKDRPRLARDDGLREVRRRQEGRARDVREIRATPSTRAAPANRAPRRSAPTEFDEIIKKLDELAK